MLSTTILSPGVTLRCFRDMRFKQGCLSLQAVRLMDASEAAMNALIPAVLLRGSKEMPTMGHVIHALDDLYGASVSTLVRRVGDYQTVGLFLSCMEDRFALPGDKILEPALGLLGQLLLEPVKEGEGFCQEYVDSEKQNLIATIESELNDKRAYAMGRLLKIMGSQDSFGIPRLGQKEDIPPIMPQALYSHYQKVLKQSPLEIFYVGSREPEEIAGLLAPILGRIPRDYRPIPSQRAFCPGQPGNHREKMDVTQGKLCMGYVTPITNRSPEFPAMQVMNTIFGAGMTSKLFQNLREKLSLCYSVGSGYYGSKGIVTISAGIDFDKEDQSRQEIFRQLEACQAGDITENELGAAKEAILSSLRATHDSPGSIEGYYATAALSGVGMDPEAYSAAVEAVTKEDVRKAANTLQPHTEFFLHG